MISIITSLAVTHLVTGIVGLIRHREPVTFSWRHACWTWTAFALFMGNWAPFWRDLAIEAWPFQLIAVNLAFMIVLYAFCALVIPETSRIEAINLKNFHEREGKRYIIAHIGFAACRLSIIWWF